MLAHCSTASRHVLRFWSTGILKPPSSASEAEFAGAPLDPAVGDQVERGDALGDAGRVVVAGRHQDDAVAEPDLLGALRAGGEEHLRRGGVRILLQEVVLDLPDVVEAQLVGQLDLVERVLEQLVLRPVGPGPRQLVFVEDAEAHRASLPIYAGAEYHQYKIACLSRQAVSKFPMSSRYNTEKS